MGAAQLATPLEKWARAVETGLLQRFLARVEITSLFGCWLWLGATAGGNRPWDSGGPYGKISVFGSKEYVHRVALCLAGSPPPSNDHVPDHLCRVRLCCSPLHVEWKTVADNARRATAIRVQGEEEWDSYSDSVSF